MSSQEGNLMTLSMRLDCVSGLVEFAFSFFFLFFLFIYLFIENLPFTWKCVCQWVPYTMHGTHYLFEHPNFSLECDHLVGLVHSSRDPQIYFLTKLSLKMNSTVLFIHFKIILLQCLQFLAK